MFTFEVYLLQIFVLSHN